MITDLDDSGATAPATMASASQRTASAALLTAPVFMAQTPGGDVAVWERQSDNWIIAHGSPAALIASHQWTPHDVSPLPASLASLMSGPPQQPLVLSPPSAASTPRSWLAAALTPEAEVAIAAAASERKNTAWAQLADALNIAYTQPEVAQPSPDVTIIEQPQQPPAPEGVM